uniref:hypothetical protein n=1 Tax=Nonomuraea sp. CA-251285 TaxID=3240002 RepID=UPI003F497F59
MTGYLKRGSYRLPDVSQTCNTDWDALTIARHYGGHAIAARSRVGGSDQYTVFSPDSPSRWQEFHSREALDLWLDAYGCTADQEEPNFPRLFIVRFPTTGAAMKPLRLAAEAVSR